MCLVAQVRQRRVLCIEGQTGRHERLRQDGIVGPQGLADLLGKGARQPRIAQQAVGRIDAPDGRERRAYVLRPLRVDEQAALQVLVEQVALPLDLVVLAGQQPVLQVLHGQGVGQKTIQLIQQRPRLRIIDGAPVRIRRFVDPRLEEVDQSRAGVFIQQQGRALLRSQRLQLRAHGAEFLRAALLQCLHQRAFAAFGQKVGNEGPRQHRGDDDACGNGHRHYRPALLRHQLVEQLHGRSRSLLAAEGETSLQGAPLFSGKSAWLLRDHPLVARLNGGEPIERMSSRQQLVGHARDRIHVIARVGLEALDHFAAGVSRCQRPEGPGIEQRRGSLDVVGALRGARDAEVEDLYRAFVRQKRVGRFEIRVHDALFVRVGHRAAQVPRQA